MVIIQETGEKALTLSDAARLLGHTSTSVLCRSVRLGRLRTTTFGDQYVTCHSWIEEWRASLTGGRPRTTAA